MSYIRMTFPERMTIFKMIYVEKKRPSEIAIFLNRSVSTITRENQRGLGDDFYNPLYEEAKYLYLRQ